MIPRKYDLSPRWVKYRGIFDNHKVQRAIFDWYEHNDFDPFDVSKVKITPMSIGEKFKVTYKGYKRVTEYIKWYMQVYIIIYDLEKVEVIKEGKKIQADKGFFTVQIDGKLEFDWQRRFKGNKLLQFLGDFLRNYILRYKIKDYWEDEADIKMNQLRDLIKEELGSEAL